MNVLSHQDSKGLIVLYFMKYGRIYEGGVILTSVFNVCVICSVMHTSGHTVAQLVEALRYKPGGRGFDSRWCDWNFSLT